MANLPSPTKVSGKFNAIYEAYYRQLDPKRMGTVDAPVAAKFLKKSGLSDVVLSRIWDLSDPTGRGYLNKEGVFVALKLVALAQAGNDINMRNIYIEPANPPKVGEIPKIQPPKILTVLPHTQDWTIGPADRVKYEALFESLLPVEGLLPGNKVRSVLMDSKLPLDALSRIWDLADQDKDGSLDKHEFLVAMHLVYQALDKKSIPASLPVELQRQKFPAVPGAATADSGFVAHFPSDIAPPPVPPLPSSLAHAMQPPPSQVPSLIPTDMLLIQTDPMPAPSVHVAAAVAQDWVVSAHDKQRFDVMFKRSDLDNDGLVSGAEIKDVFLQSGIPQLCLAMIWALCDTSQSGKLTAEQFALAMWMVERKRKGFEPPEFLAANMVPPSQRPPTNATIISAALAKNGGGGGAADLVGLEANLMQSTPVETAFENPELAMIAKEIEELVRERRQLENEVTQREADIRIKNGEVRSLQSELDTLAATLKQLENQKGEAQKRLDDLKAQVTKIREKCQKQEETIRDLEGEVDSKRGELQKLKDEETSLEREYESNKKELDNVSQFLQDTKLQISQVKSMVTQLQESQRQMGDALTICKSAIENSNPSMVSDYTLKLEPEFREVKLALEKKDEKPAEPADTSNAHGFKASNGFTPSDPFGAQSMSGSSATHGFAGAFSASGGGGGGDFDDSFGGSFGQSRADDQFHGSAATTATSTLADPFGDKSGNKAVTPDPNKDDFGSDPFAILHAPTSASQIHSPAAGHMKSSTGGPPPRPAESPSPALPPKKAKQPPPRPAPPRPSMGPTPTRPEPPSHGFGGSGGAAPAGGFADFANFDDIASMLPSQPLPPQQPPTSDNGNTANKTVIISANSITSTTTAFPSVPSATSIVADRLTASTPAPVVPATTTTNATDFIEDPFKDYRYEDPFNIVDPFDDDNNAITDQFASIIAVAPSPVPSNVGTMILPAAPTVSLTGTIPKTVTPVPSSRMKTPAGLSAVSKSAIGGSTSALFNNQFDADTSMAQTADFFDAFHDNFGKNTNSKPTSTGDHNRNQFSNNHDGNATKTTNLDKAFDPFGVPTASTAVQQNATFAANFDDDDFFAKGFEDEFAKVKVPNAMAKQTTVTINNLHSNNTSGGADFARFDAFDDGVAAGGTTSTSNGNGFGASDAKFDDPFADARFDDGFGVASAKVDNVTAAANNNVGNGAAMLPKLPNKLTIGGAKKINNNHTNVGASAAAVETMTMKNPQYAADYSKSDDTFDKDLQEALQRSMIDQ